MGAALATGFGNLNMFWDAAGPSVQPIKTVVVPATPN
jgi:hypothetical protein